MKEVNALLADEDVPAAGRFNSGAPHHLSMTRPRSRFSGAGGQVSLPKDRPVKILGDGGTFYLSLSAAAAAA